MAALFRRERFEPIRLGPEVERSGELVRVESGPLAGRSLRLDAEVSDIKAVYRFSLDGAEAGQCHFDRDPRTGLETFWDILVAPELRGARLASLMTRVTFRDLLDRPGPHWFGMRKLMKVDTRIPALQNLGIGIIAVRLGLRPEPLLDRLLAPGVVKSIELLGGQGQGPRIPVSRGSSEEPRPLPVSSTLDPSSFPPGLMLHLNRLPGVIVFARLDPGTGRPENDPDAYRRFTSPAELLESARAGRAVIGNIDYILAREHIERCCRHLARDAGEFRRWTRALRAGARHQES